MRQQLVPEVEFRMKLIECLGKLKDTRDSTDFGDYLEFGVFNGTSLACAYHAFAEVGLHEVRLFGFDSFEGLPEQADSDDEGVWLPGEFACSIDVTKRNLSRRGVDWRRVFLIEGWFDTTLTPTLLEQYELRKISVAMIDCDIYSSTATSLNFIEPLIQDQAVIIFDDWYALGLAGKKLGQARAFEEFLARHRDLTAQPLGGYNKNSLIFHIVRRG